MGRFVATVAVALLLPPYFVFVIFSQILIALSNSRSPWLLLQTQSLRISENSPSSSTTSLEKWQGEADVTESNKFTNANKMRALLQLLFYIHMYLILFFTRPVDRGVCVGVSTASRTTQCPGCKSRPWLCIATFRQCHNISPFLPISLFPECPVVPTCL